MCRSGYLSLFRCSNVRQWLPAASLMMSFLILRKVRKLIKGDAAGSHTLTAGLSFRGKPRCRATLRALVANSLCTRPLSTRAQIHTSGHVGGSIATENSSPAHYAGVFHALRYLSTCDPPPSHTPFHVHHHHLFHHHLFHHHLFLSQPRLSLPFPSLPGLAARDATAMHPFVQRHCDNVAM